MTIETNLSFPPGATLAEELDGRGISRRELATRLQKPQRFVHDLMAGRRAVTADVALDLEAALGENSLPAQFWMNLETNHQLRLERQRRAAQKSA